MRTLLALCALIGAASALNCVEDPTQMSCMDYMYPSSNSTADIELLCDAMPYMIGCTIYNRCVAGDLNGQYCHDLSIIADICVADPMMSMMNGCQSYLSMCADGTMVAACADYPYLPSIIGTFDTINDIISMCGQMEMNGCDECTAAMSCPEPLDTMANLCSQMYMSECADYNEMCSVSKEIDGMDSLCGSSAGGAEIPLMRMYFHTGIRDYVLFYEWVPRTNGGFAGAWFFTFFLGVISTGCKVLRNMVEQHWANQRNGSGGSVAMTTKAHKNGGAASTATSSPVSSAEPDTAATSAGPGARGAAPRTWASHLPQNLVRGTFTAFITVFDYCLMLIAMTFNVALFFGVIAGLVCGTVLWGHLVKPTGSDPECC